MGGACTHSVGVDSVLVWKHFCLAVTHQVHLHPQDKLLPDHTRWLSNALKITAFNHRFKSMEVFLQYFSRPEDGAT